MDISVVRPSEAERHSGLLTFLCFFAIYIVWGSTYLAIRLAVEGAPPVFTAGLRFTIAGAVLFGFAVSRKGTLPTRSEWRGLTLLAILMFLITYGCIFWAETRMPSGIAAVLVATGPIWTSLLEVFVLKRTKWRWSLLGAITIGLVGVAMLAGTSGGGKLTIMPCVAVLVSNISWSIGSVWSKELALPKSKTITAGGEMLIGGFMLLLVSLLLREVPPVPHYSVRGAAALLYLIVAGSLVAFTAYVWLLGHLPATKVASYAYVNPLVALAVGRWLGNETFRVESLFGAALILSSVVILLRSSQTQKRG